MTKHVVLDTNILFQDPRLSKPTMEILLSQLASVRCQLYVPSVVIDESVNQFRRRCLKAFTDTEKLLSELSTLVGRPLPLPVTSEECDLVVSSYRQYLEDRLRMHGACILPIPNVSHYEVLQRAITRRKPFNESGKGYQDALIWYTVLELFKRTDGTIFLVTGNARDFGQNGKLADNLVHELGEDELSGNRVFLETDLTDFVSREFLPELEVLEKVKRDIEDGSFLEAAVEDWDLLKIECEIAFRDFVESGKPPFGFMLLPKFQSYDGVVNIEQGKRHCEKAVLLPNRKMLIDLYEDVDLDASNWLGEFVVKGKTTCGIRILWSAKAKFHYRCVFDVEGRHFESYELSGAELLSGPYLQDEVVEIEARSHKE